MLCNAGGGKSDRQLLSIERNARCRLPCSAPRQPLAHRSLLPSSARPGQHQLLQLAAMAERQRESRAERVASLRRRVENDPYDAASWEDLVQEADRARRGPERNQELASVYEDLLKIFPTAVRDRWR